MKVCATLSSILHVLNCQIIIFSIKSKITTKIPDNHFENKIKNEAPKCFDNCWGTDLVPNISKMMSREFWHLLRNRFDVKHLRNVVHICLTPAKEQVWCQKSQEWSPEMFETWKNRFGIKNWLGLRSALAANLAKFTNKR